MYHVALGLLLTLATECFARPNVIWIMADDLGWGEVGVLDARSSIKPCYFLQFAGPKCRDFKLVMVEDSILPSRHMGASPHPTWTASDAKGWCFGRLGKVKPSISRCLPLFFISCTRNSEMQKTIAKRRFPNLSGSDKLQAYAGYTVCAPSRTAFFTGRHSGRWAESLVKLWPGSLLWIIFQGTATMSSDP